MFSLDPAAETAVRQRLGIQEADAFLARLERLSFDIVEPLEQLYGGVVDVTGFVTELVLDALGAAAGRPAALRMLDRRREIDPGWFQRSSAADGLGQGQPAQRPELTGRPRVRRDPGLIGARRALLALRSGGATEIFPTENRSVLAYRRTHPRSAPFLSLTNFSDTTQSVDAGIITRAGLGQPRHAHSTTGDLDFAAGRIELPPWSFAWLTGI